MENLANFKSAPQMNGGRMNFVELAKKYWWVVVLLLAPFALVGAYLQFAVMHKVLEPVFKPVQELLAKVPVVGDIFSEEEETVSLAAPVVETQ